MFRKIILTVAVLAICSCGSKKSTENTAMKEQELKEQMMNANRNMVEEEAEQINDFIERHHWKMEKTGTGLRYEIYREGKGMMAGLNDSVLVAYSLFLLDGTLCYTADSTKPVGFIIGRGEQPRGFEEALLLMKEGSLARLILPAHLAFGMTGDNNKIPGGSAVYYDVHLLKVQHAK